MMVQLLDLGTYIYRSRSVSIYIKVLEARELEGEGRAKLSHCTFTASGPS